MTALPYALLVLDLDGTAITRKNEITPRDRAAAARLRALGVQITIATGRLFPGARHAAEALGVEGHVAVMNGSEHVHARTRAIRHRWGVPAPSRKLGRQVFDDHGLESFLFASGAIHHGRRSARHAPYLRYWTDTLEEHADILEASAWDQGDEVLAVCALGSQERITAARAAIEPQLPEDLSLVEFDTFGGERFLEIRHRHEDKASALRRLAAERGFGAEQTVAVGDWFNDLPMLKAAGLSYAMRGSDPAVVAAADEVLPADRGTGGAVEAVARLVWGV